MKPAVDVLIEPPNRFKIEKLWLFISRSPDGAEGVCASTTPGFLMPLIAADQERLGQLTKEAERLARATSKEIVLVEFSVRTELRKITGPSS